MRRLSTATAAGGVAAFFCGLGLAAVLGGGGGFAGFSTAAVVMVAFGIGWWLIEVRR